MLVDDCDDAQRPRGVRLVLDGEREVEGFLVPSGIEEDGVRMWMVFGPAGEAVPADGFRVIVEECPAAAALGIAVERDASGELVFSTPPQAWHTPN